MSTTMEEFFAIRDILRMDKELLRLASLVGTDAKTPEDKLANYIAETIMYYRYDGVAVNSGGSKHE